MLSSLAQLIVGWSEGVELERSGRGQDGRRTVEMAVVAVRVSNDRRP